MLLNNSEESFELLYNTVNLFLKGRFSHGVIFEVNEPNENALNEIYVRFLINRKFVFEYRICKDRGSFLSSVSMAIGPAYFMPADFWDFDNSKRFNLEPTEFSIRYNLNLLEEFIKTH